VAVGTLGETLHIFEHKVLGVQLRYQAQKVLEQKIARIIKCPFADQGKTLAGGAPKHHIYVLLLNGRIGPDVGSRNCGDTATKHRPMGEIELVDGTVNGIDFDGCQDIKTRLLEAQGHATRSRK
jgi:hypothetical protein